MTIAHLAIRNIPAIMITALLFISPLACSQQTLARNFDGVPDGTDPTAFTMTKEVNEVNLVFTVSDSKGHLRNNLVQEDFQFLDNRQQVGQIRYFHRQSVLPLRVALLIDISSSIASHFNFEKKAADVFLRKVLRKQVDEAFVATFDSDIHLIHDWSSDPSTLFASIRGLPKPGGYTALFDAINFACNKLQARRGHTVTRQVIILITDGADTASKAFMSDAQLAATKAEVLLFSLSTNNLSYGEYPKGEAVLDMLSRNTGGQVLPARDKDQLGHAFRKIESSIRSQYAIGYVPESLKADGAYHTVEILPRKSGLTVHGRKGYFAPRAISFSQ